MSARWTVDQAKAWGEKQPWFFGANFTPSTAINQLEMWQADTFDPNTIERELGFGQKIGMNIMRVYLHDLLWEHDREGFIERMDQYLSIAYARGIKTMFVIFDDCWQADFALGKQPDPIPYTHNSGWVQSPGRAIVEDPTQWDRLERYVKELLDRFKDDPRVAVWDLYNEPSNGESGDPDPETAAAGGGSIALLESVFNWARTIEGLTQPLTVAHWHNNKEINICIANNCDIVSYHCYDAPEGLLSRIEKFDQPGRPLICTEYLARGRGSTFADCTPIMRQRGDGAINWGLVSGKTQTIYPWGWNEEKGVPPVWHHDIFNPDGSFLYPGEEADIRRVIETQGK